MGENSDWDGAGEPVSPSWATHTHQKEFQNPVCPADQRSEAGGTSCEFSGLWVEKSVLLLQSWTQSCLWGRGRYGGMSGCVGYKLPCVC